ncbi:CPBP family intramembrane glutamic endopeptidase [Zhihengliuella salsuginis]|uniref:CAAX prenyl protease 2/Lysostaphin resistance protein A-like domain-containing protein n=1 Tax=Zhihengliuella salsuginis TaxID=578222 RepID=A0ABQ3GEW3_9MICC|nr:type II CAAX endopeptidase family protein [Zhihengliuella salsuginis]GHD02407.1 hypothetical protein GCM10008096_07500 [Zhihengliuella salsuginis]
MSTPPLTAPPSAPRLSFEPGRRLPAWAPRFLIVFAVLMLALVGALCAPALAGAGSAYLEVLTPVVMWAPAVAVVILHFAFGRPVPLLTWAGLRGAPFKRIVGGIAALLVLMLAVPAAVIGLAAAFGFVEFSPSPEASGLAVWVLPLIAATMLLTLGEEFAWRGYLASTLAPWGFWRSAAAIGAFWALWHLPLTAAYAVGGVSSWREVAATTVNLFLAALVLAGVRYLTRSVWPAVAGHAMLNTVLVFAYSNLMTDAAALPAGAYWGYNAVSWAVWGAAAVLVGSLAARRARNRATS